MHILTTRIFQYCLAIAFLAGIGSTPALSAHPRIPSTWDVIADIHKDLDDLSRTYRRSFKANSDAILRGIDAENTARRAVISPLYQKAFNTVMPPGASTPPAADELGALTDGKLYADAWQKSITDASVETSFYITKKVEPIISDPTTDRAAVMRIKKDAADEWEKYKGVVANGFAHDSAQITTDFEARLAALARDHRDLREALAAITGPISAADFDTDFQKYVTIAESKLQPATPTPVVPAVSQPTPNPAPAISATSPAPPAIIPADILKPTIDDLASKLDAQKQTLAALKLKTQTLDDNYPLLHHELSTQLEALSTEIFWLRLILIGVGAGTLLSIVIAFAALDRAGALNSRKTNSPSGKKQESQQTSREEPMKLILARIYHLEKELAHLQEQLIQAEKLPAATDASMEDTPEASRKFD